MAPDKGESDSAKAKSLPAPANEPRSVLRNALNLTGYIYSFLIFFSAVVLAAQYHFDLIKVAGADGGFKSPRSAADTGLQTSELNQPELNKKDLESATTDGTRHPAAENSNPPAGIFHKAPGIPGKIDSGS